MSVLIPPGTLVTPATAAAYPPMATPEGSPSIRARLLNIADTETAAARHLAQLDTDFAQRHVILRDAVLLKYLELVDALRASVREFNNRLIDAPGHVLPRLQWYETPNVTLRDAVTGDGMRVRVQRINSYFDLVLKMVHRAGKEDIPLIEGYGSIGREQIRTETLMRIEGFVEKGVAKYRYSQDFRRLDVSIAEVPDRIVMAVASHDHALLSRTFYAPLITKKTDESESDMPASAPVAAAAPSGPPPTGSGSPS